MKKALITGITGQDGSYLAELLLKKGYEVYGILRRSSSFNTQRIDAIYQDPHEENLRLKLVYGDLSDASSLNRIVRGIRPDEIYNLGSQSHVRVSFDIPEYTTDVVGLGCIRLLEAIRENNLRDCKFYQASSSEMFGNSKDFPQNEKTAFSPRSPYAAAKAYSHYITQNYREAYGLFAVNGILFNHESPRRGETFVTRKITRGLARIKFGLQEKLYLGNLDAKKDWGYAKDYVKAIWLMMQHHTPDDFVIATGKTHSVREFLEIAAQACQLNWKNFVQIDPRYYRPTEVDCLLGDASKAKQILGWSPSIGFEELVTMMMEADLKQVEREVYGIQSTGESSKLALV